MSSPFPYRKLHSGMKTYGCELCGKRFLDSLRLRMHLLAHSGRQGLLPRLHVGTDNHLMPFAPLTQSWPWSGVFTANQGFSPPCPLDPPSRSMEQKSHPESVPIRGTLLDALPWGSQAITGTHALCDLPPKVDCSFISRNSCGIRFSLSNESDYWVHIIQEPLIK